MGQSVYRSPAQLDDLDLEAREQLAAAELGRRRGKIQARVIAIAVVLGLAAGLVGAPLVTWLQIRLMGWAILLISNVVGFAAPAIGCAYAGRWISRSIVRQSTPAWLGELARTYQVPRERLELLARSLAAIS